jgi:hypothetical protein
MQHQVGDVKFDDPLESSAPYDEVKKGLITTGFAYIYPEGAKYAADAWCLPTITVGGVPVWEGQPTQNSDEARNAARTHLAEAMSKLLDF